MRGLIMEMPLLISSLIRARTDRASSSQFRPNLRALAKIWLRPDVVSTTSTRTEPSSISTGTLTVSSRSGIDRTSRTPPSRPRWSAAVSNPVCIDRKGLNSSCCACVATAEPEDMNAGGSHGR